MRALTPHHCRALPPRGLLLCRAPALQSGRPSLPTPPPSRTPSPSSALLPWAPWPWLPLPPSEVRAPAAARAGCGQAATDRCWPSQGPGAATALRRNRPARSQHSRPRLRSPVSRSPGAATRCHSSHAAAGSSQAIPGRVAGTHGCTRGASSPARRLRELHRRPLLLPCRSAAEPRARVAGPTRAAPGRAERSPGCARLPWCSTATSPTPAWPPMAGAANSDGLLCFDSRGGLRARIREKGGFLLQSQ